MSYETTQKHYAKQELSMKLAFIDYKNENIELLSDYKNVPIAVYEEAKRAGIIDYTLFRAVWRGPREFTMRKNVRTNQYYKDWDCVTKRVNATSVDIYHFNRKQCELNRIKEEAFQRGRNSR